jgi:ribonuclease HI
MDRFISIQKAGTDIMEQPTNNTSALVAFTDGACSANGKANAKGGYSSVWPFHEEHNGGWPLVCDKPTNNKAEFMGLIKSFEIADKIDPGRQKKLEVYTDSMFLINCVTKWLRGWKRNGFKKADGKPVLNQDLLLMIDELMKTRTVVLHHVRAHTGGTDWKSINNAKADELARASVK